MTESELRDRLAADISVLGAGLTLLQKERYIPNSLGTRSFIDLYATDLAGHHVLIELKRSDAAAREAVHEIYKYVEGVKAYLGARDDEIVVILASTEWRELLVPFSRFVADTKIAVRGLQLSDDSGSGRLIAAPAPTVPVCNGRFIAPWHEVHWFQNADSMESGLRTIHETFQVKGIQDYIVVLLKPPAPVSSEHQAGMRATLMQIAEMQGITPHASALPLPVYEYAAYVAMQMLSKEQYLQLLKSDTAAYEEASGPNSDQSEEERLHQLHETLAAMEPRPQSDHLEIGYAAKLGKFLDAKDFQIKVLLRRGLFDRNALLDDDLIIAELRGEDGATGQRFKRALSMANNAQVASAKRAIASCLEHNKIWRSHILREIEEIGWGHPNSEVDISIYNPQTGLYTVYFTATREDGALFVPTYSLLVNNPEPVCMYYGGLQSAASPATFRSILRKYYNNDLGQLLLAMTWGGRDERDIDILEDLGAMYRSFRCDIEGTRRRFFALRDDRWRECGQIDPLSLWGEYLHSNETLVTEIVRKIGACDRGNRFENINSRLVMEKHADVATARTRGIYLPSPPEHCDICGCLLSEEDYFVDGKLKSGDISALMCADCFVVHGLGIGADSGRLYFQSQGKWLQVGGFSE